MRPGSALSGSYPGPNGEFETCPDWAPSLDKRRQCARFALRTMDVCGFDQRASCLTEVRNVSRLGSQVSKLQAGFELAVALAGAVQGDSWLWLRNLHDPVLPFVGVRSRPYQHQRVNDISQGHPLLDEKDARTMAIRFNLKTAVDLVPERRNGYHCST